MLLDQITPLILTYNEAPNIGRALDRLAWARRIVVVDSYSTDGTLDLLRRDARITVLQRPFDHFAAQCNYGLTAVETPWVLSLDADYLCTAALVREIAVLPDDPPENGFAARFQYCIHGKPLRGSLYPPRVVLYRRGFARYERDGHAHRVRVDGAVRMLAGTIQHDDRKPLSAWLPSQRRNAEAEACKLAATPPEQLNPADRIRRLKVLAPLLVPAYCLFYKGLILDGRAGWYYTLQRTYAELLLSLELFEQDQPIADS